MEEMKLSDLFKELCDAFDETGAVKVKHGTDTIFFDRLLKQNSKLLNSRAFMDGIEYKITNDFKMDKDYILNFLLMCEDLLNNKIVFSGKFIAKKYKELVDNQIISNYYAGDTIYNQFSKKDLIEEMYNKIEYQTENNFRHKTNNDNSVNFNNSQITNSGIISGGNTKNMLSSSFSTKNPDESSDRRSFQDVNYDKKDKFKRVFISHSSNDKVYGDILTEVLRNVGFRNEQIIYSSHPLHKIPNNKNIYEYLRSNINEKVFMIYIISDSYFNSVACLNEMGANWIVQNDYAIILTPSFDYSDSRFASCPIDNNKMSFKFTGADHDKANFIELVSSLCEKFEINTLSPQNFNYYIDEYIKEITLLCTVENNSNITKSVNEDNISKRQNIDTIVESDYLPDSVYVLLKYIYETKNRVLAFSYNKEQQCKKINDWRLGTNFTTVFYEEAIDHFKLYDILEEMEVNDKGAVFKYRIKNENFKDIIDMSYESKLKMEKGFTRFTEKVQIPF